MKPGTWLTRLTWAVLPLTAAPSFDAALDEASRGVQIVASTGLWMAWVGVLTATLLPTSLGLTALRIAAPGGLAVGAWAALQTDDIAAREVLALVSTSVAAVVAFAPATADAMVNGESYGDERRLPLRPPAALLLGPIELAWLAVVAGATAGPLLLAARQWVVGAIAIAIGFPVAAVAARALHGLARRWLVFVPGGLVVHDAFALADPVLLRRASIAAITPAPLDSDAIDLTRGALGLLVEVRLSAPLELPTVQSRGSVASVSTTRVLVAPTRPGVLLTEAAARRVSVA